MDMVNSKPNEAVPASDGKAPEAVPVPVLGLANSVPGTGTPHPSGLSPRAIKTIEASLSTGGLGAGAPAPAAAPVPAPVPAPVVNTPQAPAAKVEIPQTKGTTPGGWNRFAGANRIDPRNKPKDRREGSRGRR